MRSAEQRPEVRIDADPAVWLRGPSLDADDAVRAEWVAGAMHAVATDFDLENATGGADYREYVHRVLSAFGRWRPDSTAVTLLRFRHLGDAPLPVGVELYDADEVAEISAAHGTDFVASQLDVDGVPTVGETSLEAVDGAGWQRLVFWAVDDRGQVASHVRYVRTWPDTGVVMIVRFGGGDPERTIDALGDTDDLVRSVTVGGRP